MKTLMIAVSVTALMLLVFASAFAFSASLSSLHITANSFARPSAPVIASPMTSADESNIAAPPAGTVRFEQAQTSEHVCQHDKVQDTTVGF